MASSNVFTSISDIEAWFTNKRAPVEIQTYALQHCSNCRPTIEPCATCLRFQDIFRKDFEIWVELEAREINSFKNPSSEQDPTQFQQLYVKEKAKIQEEIGIREKTNSWMGPAARSQQNNLNEIGVQERANSWMCPMNESKQDELRKWKEKLEDLDRWFDIEDEVLKAKGWF
jgi:hypothetical protein